MRSFSIESVATHAEPDATGKLVQWAEVRLLLPKDFNWKMDSEKLLKKLQAAAELVGRGE